MKLKKLAHSLALVGLGSQLVMIGAATAQSTTPAPAPAPQKIERVEVTGSSIKRIKDEGALPLDVITADEMKSMGVESTEDLLRQLGVNSANADNGVSSNSVFSPEGDRLGGGGAYANLRGLGPSGTLVLLNGRRLSNQGMSGGAVDLNAIPFEMIQRVEVLKDGASAIYGTDAIGGVINFIMKDSYEGLIMSANYSNPMSGGGGMRKKVGISGGWGKLEEQGFNIMASVSASDNEILRGIDRPWASGFQPDKYMVPDTTSSPGFANIIAGANTALATSSQRNGTGIAYTTLNALAVNGQCDTVPFGVASAPNINIIPKISGHTAAAATYRCGTDYGRQYMLAQPNKNINGVFRASFALGSSATAFAEFVGSRVETRGEFTPFQFSTTGTIGTTTASYPTGANIRNSQALVDAFAALGVPLPPATGTGSNTSVANYPVNGPYYKDMRALYGFTQFDPTKPIAYRLRMSDWGYRTIGNTSTNKRFALGVNGSWGDFDYRASLSRGEAEGYSDMIDGYADTAKLTALLASGKYNPFLMPGQTQTAETLKLIEDTKVRGRLQGGATTVDEATAVVSGPLFKLPAGNVDFALGANYRQESYGFTGTQTYNCVSSFTIGNLNLANSVMGCPGNSRAPDADRKIGAVFTELFVPVFSNLELQLALRHDRYSGNIGNTTNPKVAFKFTPMKEVLLRGSYNTGFRAPTAQQTNLGRLEVITSGSSGFADPLKCPNPVNNPDPNCNLLSVRVFTGGNPMLKPETSKQATLGLVVQPMPSLTAAVDYWQVKLSDRIHNLTYQTELANYSLFEQNFIRDETGTLRAIQAGWINAGRLNVKGLDFTLEHNLKLSEGRLRTKASVTKMISAKAQTLESTPMIQYLGNWTTSTLYIPWKGTISTNYKIADWSHTLSMTYSGSYNDETRTGAAGTSTNPVQETATSGPLERKVAAYTTFNLSTTYTGVKNWSLSAGIINLLDKQPPFTWHNADLVLGHGWDARVADPRGRTLSLGAKYTF